MQKVLLKDVVLEALERNIALMRSLQDNLDKSYKEALKESAALGAQVKLLQDALARANQREQILVQRAQDENARVGRANRRVKASFIGGVLTGILTLLGGAQLGR
jgi:hypothetical protein